jgi:citronellyl-CoA synthetase
LETVITLKDLFRHRRYLKPRVACLSKLALLKVSNRKKKGSIIPVLIETRAQRSPDKIALFYQDQEITYRQLNDHANRIAHCIKSQNIKKGDVVILFMENRIEFLIHFVALMKLGAVAALVNSSQIGQSLKYSIELVKPKAVIVGEELCEKYEEVTDIDHNVNRVVFYVPDSTTVTEVDGERKGYINLSKEAQSCSKADLNININDDDPTLFVFTSGTTGMPKATIQTNKRTKIVGIIGSLVNPLTKEDIVYCTLPLYHGTAILSLISVLCVGCSLALRRKFSASKFWDDIDKYQATSFSYVGEICRYLLNTDSPKSNNNTLKSIFGNGLRPDLWNEFKEKFQIDEVREMYSASDSNIASTNIFNIDKTVGMVVGSYAIVKYDEESEEPIPDSKGQIQRVKPGESGLLLGKISKLIPFTGYTEERETKSKVIKNVFKEGDAWFNTGDVVRDMGCRHIQFLDRSGDTFRWKGENVSTSEVEKVVNQFPGIEESVAYGVEVPHSTGRAGMVAVKLEEKKAKIDGKAFYEFLAGQLPNYAMPLFFRVNETLERTQTFKYKKYNLKQDGYALDKIKNGVHVALHSERIYTNLNSSIVNEINDNNIKL